VAREVKQESLEALQTNQPQPDIIEILKIMVIVMSNNDNN
jgi:hypothetical protein